MKQELTKDLVSERWKEDVQVEVQEFARRLREHARIGSLTGVHLNIDVNTTHDPVISTQIRLYKMQQDKFCVENDKIIEGTDG